jgi:hypothetical protein
MSANDFFIFARKPFGGSWATFKEFCRTKVGKISDGIELKNSRKF